jgi:hypothetical protein
MRKNSQLKSQSKSTHPFPWLWLVSGGAVLLVVAGLMLWWSGSNTKPTEASQPGSKPIDAPQTEGKPKLVVDQALVDDGYVKFDTPVHVSFKLSNPGNQPLQIVGEPKVELIEGC